MFFKIYYFLKNKKLPKSINLTVEKQDVTEIIRLSAYMDSRDIKTPESNSSDIQFLEKRTQLTEMQTERIKEALEKQEIIEPILSEEEVKVKQQEIEQKQWFSFCCLELQKYIKDNSFEKLNKNDDIWWNNKLLQNKILDDKNLNEETKQKWLNELIANNKFK